MPLLCFFCRKTEPQKTQCLQEKGRRRSRQHRAGGRGGGSGQEELVQVEVEGQAMHLRLLQAQLAQQSLVQDLCPRRGTLRGQEEGLPQDCPYAGRMHVVP